jgi:hypothetical protein
MHATTMIFSPMPQLCVRRVQGSSRAENIVRSGKVRPSWLLPLEVKGERSKLAALQLLMAPKVVRARHQPWWLTQLAHVSPSVTTCSLSDQAVNDIICLATTLDSVSISPESKTRVFVFLSRLKVGILVHCQEYTPPWIENTSNMSGSGYDAVVDVDDEVRDADHNLPWAH